MIMLTNGLEGDFFIRNGNNYMISILGGINENVVILIINEIIPVIRFIGSGQWNSICSVVVHADLISTKESTSFHSGTIGGSFNIIGFNCCTGIDNGFPLNLIKFTLDVGDGDFVVTGIREVTHQGGFFRAWIGTIATP